MPEWAFITKHAVALSLIAKNPRITALELGAELGVTERAVRKIIADLYNAGYVSKKRAGRGVRYRINPDLSLRQDSHQEVGIGDFLATLGWKKNSRRKPQSK